MWLIFFGRGETYFAYGETLPGQNRFAFCARSASEPWFQILLALQLKKAVLDYLF